METIWSITKLTCFPVYEGQANVVANIEWKAVGTEIVDGVTYTSEEQGITGSGFSPDITDFTEYNDLTEQQILSWVWSNGTPKMMVEATLQASIDAKKNPTVVTPQLPWSN